MTPAIPLRAKFPLSTLDDRARTDVWSTCDGGSPRSSPRPGLYRRTKSAPSSPHAQEFGPPPRRRVRSHEISALKFGASFAIKQAAPEFPRVLEVTVTWRSKPQIYAFELRRLVFWFVVVAFLLLPASGLKITPAARASHGGPGATTASTRRLPDAAADVGVAARFARSGELPRHYYQPSLGDYTGAPSFHELRPDATAQAQAVSSQRRPDRQPGQA